MRERTSNIIGWMAVAVATLVTSFWAYWGILENFHEGWYFPSLGRNLGLLFGQYLSPMLIFMALSVTAVFARRVGAILFMFTGIGLGLLFFKPTVTTVGLITVPLCLFGSLFLIGRPKPQRRAAFVLVGLPSLIVLGFGVPVGWRVLSRIHDGDLGARQVDVPGLSLTWAPAGPGWPKVGVDWNEARSRCRLLSADGLRLETEVQDIWRLPTVDECVRSSMRHGHWAGGSWDPESKTASYETMPDKESPLWDGYSPVIYWWTATEVDNEKAYMFVYNGGVYARNKSQALLYRGFRAVKTAD